MKANYHTHTVRCKHASGSEREYIENAIADGIDILGFSDHSLQFFKRDIVSAMRMAPEEGPEYVSTLKKLAEEYKDQIRILVGFEAEYFPDLFYDLQKFCRDYGVDYLIMGQHFLHDELPGHYVGTREGDFKTRLTEYVNEVIEGISTGSFTYIAHPDTVFYPGEDEHYRKEMSRLCAAAKKADVPLEINMLGCATDRHYPSRSLFRIAKETGNDCIIGRDAHSPDFLIDKEAIEKVERFARECGITPLETVTLKKI